MSLKSKLYANLSLDIRVSAIECDDQCDKNGWI